MNTLNKITAVLMMVGSAMLASSMIYNIVLMLGRIYTFKWECIVFFLVMVLLSVALFKEGVQQYKGKEL